MRGFPAWGIVLLLVLPAAGLVRGDGDLVATLGGRVVTATPTFFNGTLTSTVSPLFGCSASSCLDFPLTLSVPVGFWASVHGGLALEARAHAANAQVQVSVLDARGNVVATANQSGLGGALVQTTQPLYDSVAILRDLDSGSYTVRLTTPTAPTTVTLVAMRQDRAQQPAAELLPDLVVLSPIEHVSDKWDASKNVLSCRPLETAEATPTPTRCLRFDTRVADLGPGALLLHIPQQQALKGLVCSTQACPVNAGDAVFTQDVERTDYAVESFPVSPAIYHAGHNHYHIADFISNELYAYDLATRTRGAVAASGHKDGFCPIDDALIALGMPDVEQPGPTACQVNGGDITIRLDSNFWDDYPASIDDQYVDITSVPPGVYELVTTVNPTGIIHETDATNNEASVLVQITPTDVKVLS